MLQDLAAYVARDRNVTAGLLARIAEVDARRLYLPAAYSSMFDYCVHELRLSEHAAYKRIRAARMARKFPVLFDALADGRLHLTAVVCLKGYLNEETVDELLAAATHKTKSEIEQYLARRFPRREMPASVEPVAPRPSPAPTLGSMSEQLVPGPVEVVIPRPKVAPIAPERFHIQFTIGQNTHDKLRYAQQLLSHQVPSGDIAELIDQALDALIGKLEKRKFAATDNPRKSVRRSTSARHVPAHVQRAVWQRDGGQCT